SSVPSPTSATACPSGGVAPSGVGADRAVDAGSSFSADWMVFWTSSCAFRNSRIPRPMDRPTSGSRRGPTTSRAMTRMPMSSRGPMVNIRRWAGARGDSTARGSGRAARRARRAGGQARGPRGRPLPPHCDVLGDGLDLLLEPTEGPTEQEHVANQPHEHDGDGQGADQSDDDRDGGGRGHAEDVSRAVGSALTGAAPLDVPVVLAGGVEVDDGVDGEGGASGEASGGLGPL